MVKYNSQVYFHLIRTKQSFPPHQLIKSNFVADRNDTGQPQRKNEHWMFEHFPKHLNRLIIYNMILYQFQYQQKPLDGVYLLKIGYLSTRRVGEYLTMEWSAWSIEKMTNWWPVLTSRSLEPNPNRSKMTRSEWSSMTRWVSHLSCETVITPKSSQRVQTAAILPWLTS